jgi:hypothetical protein
VGAGHAPGWRPPWRAWSCRCLPQGRRGGVRNRASGGRLFGACRRDAPRPHAQRRRPWPVARSRVAGPPATTSPSNDTRHWKCQLPPAIPVGAGVGAPLFRGPRRGLARACRRAVETLHDLGTSGLRTAALFSTMITTSATIAALLQHCTAALFSTMITTSAIIAALLQHCTAALFSTMITTSATIAALLQHYCSTIAAPFSTTMQLNCTSPPHRLAGPHGPTPATLTASTPTRHRTGRPKLPRRPSRPAGPRPDPDTLTRPAAGHSPTPE